MTLVPIKVLERDSRRAVITSSKVEVADLSLLPMKNVPLKDMRSTDMDGEDDF